jgi:hypothetical protein
LLVKHVNDQEDGDLIDLLSSIMIVIDPNLRRSAQDCYREALRLITASHERCLTPTPASYGYKPVAYYPAEGKEVGDGNLHTSPNVSTAKRFYLEDVVKRKVN